MQDRLHLGKIGRAFNIPTQIGFLDELASVSTEKPDILRMMETTLVEFVQKIMTPKESKLHYGQATCTIDTAS